jgi:integrase
MSGPLITAMVTSWKARLSKRTAYSRRNALGRFLRFVDRTHNTRIADQLPKLQKPGPRTTIATDTETAAILAKAPLWMKCFILLCRGLGLRHSEASHLTPAHFREDTQTITFDRKGAGTSNLPVPPELAQMIRTAALHSPTDPIIKSLGCNGTHIMSIGRTWRRLRRDAAANPNLCIHDLRRTIATQLYDATKDLRAVQQLLGHNNLSSTLLYIAPLDPERLRSLLSELRPINLSQMKPATEMQQ